MRSALFFFVFFISTQAAFGQTVEETYPKTLWCPNDLLTWKRIWATHNIYSHKGYPESPTPSRRDG
jgi:hypothetical protein